MATRSEQVARPVARRLHPLTPFLGVFDRQALAPLVLGLGTGQIRLLALAGAALLALQVLRWWRRTWVLDEGVLRVESGLLARSQQTVPTERIQQVTISSKLRHRVFGVVSLRVEVAGGGGDSGVELEALDRGEAAALRSALLAAREASGDIDRPEEDTATPPTWVPAEWPLVELGYRQLALAGLTGAQLLVVFAVVGSAVQFFDQLPGTPLRRLGDLDVQAGTGVVVLTVVVFVAVWLGSAVAASVLKDGGYTLSLMGDELHVRRGLLDRKEVVLPLARVQEVVVTASPLRRLLGYVSVRVRGAGSGTEQEERRVVVPLLAADRVEDLVALLLRGAGPLPSLEPAPRAALRRSVVRWTAVPSLAAVAIALALRPWGALALLCIPVAVALGAAGYRGLGVGITDSLLAARTGALVRRTAVVRKGRAQSVRTRASVFQRRAGLATLVVDLAGPGANPRVVDQATGKLAAIRTAFIDG